MEDRDKLAPVDESDHPRAQTGLEKGGHHRFTNYIKSGNNTKEEYPSVDVPDVVCYQSEFVFPTVILKYVSVLGGFPPVVARPMYSVELKYSS